MDDEYRLVNKDALLLITKATEMFVSDLAGTCARIAKQQKRKTLQLKDILEAAKYIDKFHFIHDSKLPSLTPKEGAAAIQVEQAELHQAERDAEEQLDHLSLDEEDLEQIMQQD